ncbi:MAG: glucosidase [Verrucomicrobiales bacterium]|nr:glucosidase [Verrucomicrobiales bacterium]
MALKKKRIMNPERRRLSLSDSRKANWQRWGPYLAERQWGTVREDYSHNGDAWHYFPHDHSRSRAYRWGEDGLLGFTDRQCRLCFGLALWNSCDPILKERLYGLTGHSGNHGEDVKELYYYLDATPTSSYVKSLYKYPQSTFPYDELTEVNLQRDKKAPEYEILDTGAFANDAYWDITAEYAKTGANDIHIRITAENRGLKTATLQVLPQLWFRNTWTWICEWEEQLQRPSLELQDDGYILAQHETLSEFGFYAREAPAEWLFTENMTNRQRLYNAENESPYVKDAFHNYIIHHQEHCVNPEKRGTKAAARYELKVRPGKAKSLSFRLASTDEFSRKKNPFARTKSVFDRAIAEADSFYSNIINPKLSDDDKSIQRQAYAGLLQSKQFYHYSVRDWMAGDPSQPSAPPVRVRNTEWKHLYNRAIISMPDKWEYPWYAAWDLAFHAIPFTEIDPKFAKDQLVLFLREWYMHPNGQIPAYEWNFSDVNPPVHAWAVWQVYKMTGSPGERDRIFLAECFHKLMLNFTWWVNRKDPEGKNLFSGGFLGLDNIGAFDRSKPLPDGTELVQADGTAWMAFYAGTMLSIAVELASKDKAYEGVASKFLEHFISIAEAAHDISRGAIWHEKDGFYYDSLRVNGKEQHMAIRSLVGLLPICSVELLSTEVVDRLPLFKRRMEWFIEHNQIFDQDESSLIFGDAEKGTHPGQMLIAMPSQSRLERVLQCLFDEDHFLSPYGIRSLSKYHEKNPFKIKLDGSEHTVAYTPAESDNYLFGGNSNWRGPVWFPVNYLIIEALEKYHSFYGDSLKVEYPTGSGNRVTLDKAADDISRRLVSLFQKDGNGDRPVHRDHAEMYRKPGFSDLSLFYEYFHGDNGRGVGASHQTGWTGLVAKLMEKM